MVAIADSLCWALINKNNSKMMKVNGRTKRTGCVRFSKEANNLASLHSFKYSGLANSKAVGVNSVDNKITLSTKTVAKASNPVKSVAKTPLNSLNVIKSLFVQNLPLLNFFPIQQL